MYCIPETEAPRCQERIHRRESRQIEVNSFQSFFRGRFRGLISSRERCIINTEQNMKNRRSQACHQLSIDSERRIINHPLIITFFCTNHAIFPERFKLIQHCHCYLAGSNSSIRTPILDYFLFLFVCFLLINYV